MFQRLSNLSLLGLVLGAVACSTAPVLYPAHPLTEQIIKARKGHDGRLTNRAVKIGADGKSLVEEITDYPLHDPAFRTTANKLDFLCNIGGKRYKICKDKPGFCRIGYTQNCVLFFCKDVEQEVDYIPVDNYQFLLDSNARCANKKEYDLWGSR